ncbi:hypothetical protein HLK59_30505 [Streptomyces sp. S3(2020)]|uniref:DUF6304 family protein n=1 Tax=Streptomyces sp. S3(2020) TaxID=2732044 RepID=UPI0014889E7A|nr:DUF6304 family protein [Streptomyces sp. S3(2020)]NNN34616.1 hypothetical protein [Streptomyces sp. S3(2020)]
MTGLSRWPGRYTDRHGSEEIVFESDGRELIRTTIRGVRFEGETMDTLGALTGEPPEQAFTFAEGDLWSCLLEWGLTMPVEVSGQGERIATVHGALQLWYPDQAENLTVTLRLDGYEFRATHPDFEDALHEIGRELPRAVRLKACIACAWSDYHPVGHGMMTGLACFRGAKDVYRRCDGKKGPNGILTIWPRHTEFVQETWICDQFEHRTSDRGYRGPFPFRGWN